MKLFAPDFALIELNKYKELILEKTKQTNFNNLIKDLKSKVEFLDLKIYDKELKFAKENISDKKDISYLALAIKLNCPIWSNDKHLKEQTKIPTFNTKELILLLSGFRKN